MTQRGRARELGLNLGLLDPGPLNAITDVAGIRVGHCTVVHGDPPGGFGKGPARTGVTAIWPGDGDVMKTSCAVAPAVDCLAWAMSFSSAPKSF